jgi:ribonuclease E
MHFTLKARQGKSHRQYLQRNRLSPRRAEPAGPPLSNMEPERHGFLQKQEIHSDYFQDTPSGDRSIENIIKRGQELLVQVTKDPIDKKGAMLTTYISLPGRFVVLMPGSKNVGISRKVEDEENRMRLKEIVGKLQIPEEFGMIVRTAGAIVPKRSCRRICGIF